MSVYSTIMHACKQLGEKIEVRSKYIEEIKVMFRFDII